MRLGAALLAVAAASGSPLYKDASQPVEARAASAALAQKPQQQPLYKDPSQPVEARVADLLPRMTLQEKVAQLLNPWPTKFNCSQLLSLYGGTSFGAVYAYSIENCAGAQNNSEALTYLQAQLTAHSRLGIPVATI